MKTMKSDVEKIDLEIYTKNILGRKNGNINIILKRIDDYFYGKPKIFQAKTNNEGLFHFKQIPKGFYLIQW